jgi:hypothetical protein
MPDYRAFDPEDDDDLLGRRMADADGIGFDARDEGARYFSDPMRAVFDNQPIDVEMSLEAALEGLPDPWLDAACMALRIRNRGLNKQPRRAKVVSIVASLGCTDDLARCILEMPPQARAALRRVLESGGSIRLSTLERDFGDMFGDGWFWNEQPPTSLIGELRRRALLFVGKSTIERDGKLSKRAFRVAMVPRELRKPLQRILADGAIRREEEHALASYYASPGDLLKDALDGVRAHYDNLDFELQLARHDVIEFLRSVSKDGFNPILVWTSVETLLEYLYSAAHEVRSMNDLCGYHISELATEFVDQHYMQRWVLDERRELIETVRRLIVFLRARGVVDAECEEEVLQACVRLNTGKRKLNLINRPPPLGGELLLVRVNPNTGLEERYTINHQRLIMVWANTFHQDWRTILQRCSDVPDGARKAELIQDLIALEPAVCELLIARTQEHEAEAAINWFYEENVIFLSAW